MKLSAQGGKIIFEQVERALQLLESAENCITEMKTTPTGTIRIGASDTIFEYFLADKIVDFHNRFPAVKIDLLADFSPDTIEKLKEDKCDVAFVNLPISPDPELRLHGNCMLLNDIFIAGQGFEGYKEEKNSLSSLQKLPLIFMDKNTVSRKSLDNFLSSVGVSLTPAIEVGSWDLMKRLVARGMGVGVIPKEYALKELEDGLLFEIQTDVRLPVRSVGMLLSKTAPVSYALHSFIQEFIEKE
jgi:DNA-binding transcriptional LysR family regulator